ncbi:conserved hypothetical protein [Neospora caninum Liverpool]|uniref:Uncharacterized protein n=1 Tax=Neospora caninum (strain Liverpool) TaxID=572307 RepID=F0VG08_NEOCL|nr:conserved hypothetical protein [Neospora caninum Liverpool]CBZ52652.1 conserved hypothetical protein [Neospora caninum Liverpool]CEL66629.1 TPA: hypothetical protein BN1204_024400 [Neospora caninum Liverpool]|eukprot:XP_003882684.1 conserved hypothetical protein [Neospora caninum Liverpool]
MQMANSAQVFSPRLPSRVSPETALRFAVAASTVERRSLRCRSQSSQAVLHQEGKREEAVGAPAHSFQRAGETSRRGPTRSSVATASLREEHSASLSPSLRERRSPGRASHEQRDASDGSESSEDDASVEPRKKSRSGGAAANLPLSRKTAEREKDAEGHTTPRVPLLTTKQQRLLLRYLCISNDEASRVLVQAAARHCGPVAGAAAVAARYLAARQAPGRRSGDARRSEKEPSQDRGVSRAAPEGSPGAELEADTWASALSENVRVDGPPQRSRGRETKGMGSASSWSFRSVAGEGRVRFARTGSSVRFRSPVAAAETQPRRLSDRPLFPDESQRTDLNFPARGSSAAEQAEPACEACARAKWGSHLGRSPGDAFSPPARVALRGTEGCLEECAHAAAAVLPTCSSSRATVSVASSPTPVGTLNRFSRSLHGMLVHDSDPRPYERCREHCAIAGSSPAELSKISCHCLGTGGRECVGAPNVSSSSSAWSCCSNASAVPARTASSGDRACCHGNRHSPFAGVSETRRPAQPSHSSSFGPTARARGAAGDASRESGARPSCPSCPSCAPSPASRAGSFASPDAVGGRCSVDQGCACSSYSACGSCQPLLDSSGLERSPCLHADQERRMGCPGADSLATRPTVSVACTPPCTGGRRSSLCDGPHADAVHGSGQRQGAPVVRHRVFLRPAATALESPGTATPVRRGSLSCRSGHVEERRQTEARPFHVHQQRDPSGNQAGNTCGVGESRTQREAEQSLGRLGSPAQTPPSLHTRPQSHAQWESTRSSVSPGSMFLPCQELGPRRAGVPPAGQVCCSVGETRSREEGSVGSAEASKTEAESNGRKQHDSGITVALPSSILAPSPRSEHATTVRHRAPVAARTKTEHPSTEEGQPEDLYKVLERQQRELAEQLRLLELIETHQVESGFLGQRRDPQPGASGSQSQLSVVRDARQTGAHENVGFLDNAPHLLHLDVEVVRRGRGKPWSVSQTVYAQSPDDIPYSGSASRAKTEGQSHGWYPPGSTRVNEGNRLRPEAGNRLKASDNWTTTQEQDEQQLRELEDVVWTLAVAERNHASELLRV